MGRRITRKQLKEDEFVSTIDTFLIWFKDHWRPFAAALAAVCGIAVLWWLAGLWTDSRAQDASYQLREAVAAFEEAQAAGTGDLTVARERLQAVADDHGRSDQADMARLYLARVDMTDGDMDSARGILVELVEHHRDDMLGRLATLDLVHMRVAAGQGAEVAQELQVMVVGKDTRLPRDVALYELGDVYFKERDFEQAREYLQKLVDEFPESPYVGMARQRLSEIS